MSGSLPFYQKHHRHYDRDYRSKETVSKLSQYQTSSRYTAGSSTSAATSRSSGLNVSTHYGLEASRLSPILKRAKPTYLAVDKDHQIIGYVVPIFRGSQEFGTGFSSREEARVRDSSKYMAHRDLFTSGMEMERSEQTSRREAIRETAERISLNKRIHEHGVHFKRMNEDNLMHTPEFVIKPRSHTVWEKQCVRLHCTVSGWPDPRVVWYKNNVAIDPVGHGDKYKLESKYNMHSLEINRCDFDDTAQYRVSAMNSKGELSSFASVVVKRFKGDMDESLPSPRHGPVCEYGVNFKTHIVDKFGVTFGREGETISLGCTVIISPALHRYQPEIQWYRDDVLLSPSKWYNMHWSGDHATMTLTHLNKEDEGLYTLRVTTKSGYETYSAYVFVRDSEAEVERAPGAPLDVRCLDANKDYIIVTWKQPAVDGGDSILGYFVDRCEVGTNHWVQCNDTPVKFARFPVTGLVEGRSYMFRVRAVNQNGMSHPSRVSEPVAAMDPSDRARIRGASAPWTGQIIVTEEEPAEGIVPGRPLELQVTEATKNYVVLSWKPPGDKGLEGVMYYVEKCVAGSDTWQRVNTEIPVKSPRFALFDLAEGNSYSFRVRCCNAAGVGEPSDPTEATTVGDKLDIPSAPSKVVPIRNTDTSVVVSWQASSEAKELVGYYIEASVLDSNEWEPCNNKPVNVTRFICHGLTTGEKYVFRVRAVNAAGLSQFSPESEPVEVKAAIASPAPPYGITVLECVFDSMVLSWKQPTFIGGADITGYFVDYREVIDGVTGKWHEANIRSISERAYRVSDLKEKRKYQFQVRAANMAGVGIPSLPSDTFLCEEWTIAVPGWFDLLFLKSYLISVPILDKCVLILTFTLFKELQKESEFQMKEWVRKQGPHFIEYLGYEVTPECCVVLKCKVGNMKKDTSALWYKDGHEIKADENLGFTEGVLKLEIAQRDSPADKADYADDIIWRRLKISKKDSGVYEVVLKDDRGKDTSTLNLTDKGFKDLMNEVFSFIANSSTPLKITSTENGIRLYTFVSYYNDLLQVTWHYKDSAISFSDRIKSGVVGEQLWLQISEPSEKDMGKYAIEFNDGKGGLRRTVELSGQAFDDAFAEFQRLKAAAIAERSRARVAGGLPDVVTIQDGKALNLTCNISGDPVPEVTWLKNDREITSDEHCILKFESGKFASFTITGVNISDSGKYSILVKNKYGTESGDFTVSVFISEGAASKKK
ncbi:myomesin-1 [Notothenia coriiceps]|uniref:Myomesin-1 n=1 Tax=Notothenia coriiceps TaxID=8208 RepID=A0A6I9NIP9_9TELE|nr:PREDICTED: myomesin-1 [Notothenia coriiceps]